MGNQQQRQQHRQQQQHLDEARVEVSQLADGADANQKNRGQDRPKLNLKRRTLTDDEKIERADMPQRFSTAGFTAEQIDMHRRRIRLLAYGDSLTAGFYRGGKRFAPYAKFLVERLAPHFDAEIWMCGLSGLTAAELVEKQDRDAIWDATSRKGPGLKHLLENSLAFELALIMIGTNDLAHNLDDPQSIVEDVKKLHQICHARKLPTVVLSIPDNAFASQAQGSKNDEEYLGAWRHINASLKLWADAAESQNIVRMYKEVADIVPWTQQHVDDGGLFESDRLHFSPAGSEKLGIALAEVVRSIFAIADGEGGDRNESFKVNSADGLV